MTTFDICLAAFVLALACWSAIAGFALVDRHLYDRLVARLILSALRQARPQATPGPAAHHPLLRRGAMVRLLLDPEQPEWFRNHIARTLAASSSLRRLVREAWGRGWPVGRWRRIGAWHVLHRTSAVDLHPVLQHALAGADGPLAAAAVSMLGMLGDRRAADILVQALRAERCAPAFIVMQLERLAGPVALPALLPLLRDAPPALRRTAITLLSMHPTVALGRVMAAHAKDPDGGVRKAVARAMGEIGCADALGVTIAMLDDEEGYVRAQAVRSLHRIADTQHRPLAALVAPLRNDSDWWVRLAVREALLGGRPDAPGRIDGASLAARQADRAAWAQGVRLEAGEEG